MKWLALDCSTETAFVVVGEDQCLGKREQVGARTHSHCLLDLIYQLLEEQRWLPRDLDAIIFGRGPGSFTGLRVACSVVQGIAFAHNIPVYPVSGLQSIAHHLRLNGEKRSIITAVDARMNEFYWSFYQNMTAVLAKEQVTSAKKIVVDDDHVVLSGVGVSDLFPDLNVSLQQKLAGILTVYPNVLAMVDLVQKNLIKPVAAIQALPVYIRDQIT